MTPRRIPTDKIEVGRWYRVEDAVPEDGELVVQERRFPDWADAAGLYGLETAADLDVEKSAWRYNGPIPDTLPPREEKPCAYVHGETRFVVDECGRFAVVVDRHRDVHVTAFKDLYRSEDYCALLNAGHEALEAEREGGAS